MKFEPRPSVGVGIIGVGARGTDMLSQFLTVDHVQIAAVCDIVKDRAVRAQRTVERAGMRSPEAFVDGEYDFENLCKREDVDLVYIATPWDWHVPMALAAMRSGKHVGVEVPAAPTLEGCWDLVQTSERARRHCVMMENVCYGYNELLMLDMVQAGLFGDLLHAECGYLDDLRELLFSGERGDWRRLAHIKYNGNLYPTHGLGPVARYMSINRGDRFDSLVSMSSPSLSLAEYRDQRVPETSAERNETYHCGDVNTSTINSAKGRTIVLQYSITTPRPYDRVNLIQGTRGIFRDFPERLYRDGQEGGEGWTGLDPYKIQHEHPLWKNIGRLARGGRAGDGMDFLICYRLVQCMREGLVPDMDVYDAAAWSAPRPLSEASVAQGGALVKFPDFTQGRWRRARH